MVWSSDAWVSETIPAERACFAYLWRQAFRSGNQKLFMKLRRERYSHKPKRAVRARLRILAGSLLFLARGGLLSVRALLTARPRMDRFAIGGLNAACGLGMLASLVGFRYRHYLRPTAHATARDSRVGAAQDSDPT
jgi:hypothetical protein